MPSTSIVQPSVNTTFSIHCHAQLSAAHLDFLFHVLVINIHFQAMTGRKRWTAIIPWPRKRTSKEEGVTRSTRVSLNEEDSDALPKKVTGQRCQI